jgi:hypothetical protein
VHRAGVAADSNEVFGTADVVRHEVGNLLAMLVVSNIYCAKNIPETT